MSKNRVLWLYNHTTLMKSEVHILRELGYEVYIPKIPPFDVSITVDWKSDELLSVPQEDLNIINTVNFYTDRIPLKAMEIMNKYFQAVIFGIFPEPLKSIISGFKGIQIFHPFGLEDGISYTKIIESEVGPWLLNKMEENGTRFWFAQSYNNLSEIECQLFKRREIYLPIGMKDVTINDKWRGDNGKLLFICPRIKMSAYYRNLYEWFEKEFKEIPYSIGGAQPIAIENDRNVLGYLEQKEYEDMYPSHCVMFYHSQEKRHIHYHPFEAVKCGLPLIYMAGGLLDKLGGEKLPGRCKTLKEAKKKCMRIIKGDRKFAEEIRSTQKVLLKKMAYEYCLKEWRKNIELMRAAYKHKEKAEKKLALILPQIYEGGVLDYTIRLIKILMKGFKKEEKNVKLVLGYLENNRINYKNELRELEGHVKLRSFQWELASCERVKEISGILGLDLSYLKSEYYLLNDGMKYFQDCDYILFMADRVPGTPFLLQPYGVIVHDYIQRYVPELLGKQYERDVINLVRASDCSFTTGDSVRIDCIQYVGVKTDKIVKIPRFFDCVKEYEICINKNKFKNKKYFLWSTNLSVHKNHKLALSALKKYYHCGGKINCYVTGSGTEALKNKKSLGDFSKSHGSDRLIQYVTEVYEVIQSDPLLKKHVHFLGNLTKQEYYGLLNKAQFFFHPGYGDNGNGGAFDAAFLGVRTISSDYPAMREIDSQMGLGMCFFNGRDDEDAASALLMAEKGYNNTDMPSKEELIHFTIEDKLLCKNVYDIIKEKILL